MRLALLALNMLLVSFVRGFRGARSQTRRALVRELGAKAVAEGAVNIKNTQRKYDIDLERVKTQVSTIRRLLNVADFDVDVWFCSDSKIRELNEEWREKSKATDILSFPANDFKKPGVFEDDPALQFEKHLGDIVVAPSYVFKQMEEDKQLGEADAEDSEKDKGVSLALSTVFDLNDRVSLLLVHGILHLLGYDHETDKDWKLMTKKEEEIIAALALGATKSSKPSETSKPSKGLPSPPKPAKKTTPVTGAAASASAKSVEILRCSS